MLPRSGAHLGLHVLVRRRAARASGRGATVATQPLSASQFPSSPSSLDDGEAHQEAVGAGVRQRPQTVVVLLARGIPQSQVDGLVVHHHHRAVVVEHRGRVVAHKLVLRVAARTTQRNARATRCHAAAARLCAAATATHLTSMHVLPTAPSPTTTHCKATGGGGEHNW